jgi:hypothetical protein
MDVYDLNQIECSFSKIENSLVKISIFNDINQDYHAEKSADEFVQSFGDYNELGVIYIETHRMT